MSGEKRHGDRSTRSGGEPGADAAALLEPLAPRVLLAVGGASAAIDFLSEQMDQFVATGGVYTEVDAGGNLFAPSGVMNNPWAPADPVIQVDPAWTQDVYNGQTCLRIQWTGQPGRDGTTWAGVSFEWPDGLVGGSKTGDGWNLGAATQLSFRARSDSNADSVLIGIGIGVHDGFEVRQSIDLTTSWQPHTIDVSAYDLSNLNNGFLVLLNETHDGDGNGVTAYFDHVRYDAPPQPNLHLLQSYRLRADLPIADQIVNRNASYVYDSALAALAYAARGTAGDWERAGQIIQTFQWILDHDQIDAGLEAYTGPGQAFLRDGYSSGPIADPATGLPRSAGWTDADGQWHPLARAISTGVNAWGMLAMLQVYRHAPQGELLDDIVRIGTWIHENWHDAVHGGYTMGLSRDGLPQPWPGLPKSTEHNIDVCAAFSLLACEFGALGDTAARDLWQARADDAGQFVLSMFNETGGYFYVGTLDDGVTPNNSVLALDPQSWSVLCMRRRGGYTGAIDWFRPMRWAEDELRNTSDVIPGHPIDGFDFGKPNPPPPGEPDGVWTEGTAQMAAAYACLGEWVEFDWFRQEVWEVQEHHPNGDGQGLVAAVADRLTTGFGEVYNATLHTGATAWAVLADLGYNPFVTPVIAVSLTAPTGAESVERGQPVAIEWTGSDSQTTLDLWRCGPVGWARMGAGVASANGSQAWSTSGAALGWYTFAAQVKTLCTWADRPPSSPGWVQVVQTTGPPLLPTDMGTGLATSAAPAAEPLSNSFDWESGNWHIKVVGSPDCPVTWPGGSKPGSELQVYYTVAPQDIPQFWAFLADGFWRQVSYANSFATSYRLLQYYSSGNQTQDTCQCEQFQVLPVTAEGDLPINLAYTNNAASGDRFDIDADLVLAPPSEFLTAMTASIDVQNVTGGDVVPAWDGRHRDLAEQWELFGFSSMFVADNLTGGLPPWYDGLDPTHAYVGNVADDDYINDGFSQNGQIYVPTHDAGRIVSDALVVELDHSEGECPHVVVPGLTWYEQLVMLDQPSGIMRLEHLYEPGRDHQAELLAAGGLVSDLDSLKWAATYNRNDPNMVDGDNLQVKLGLDDVLNVWPAGGVQSLDLRLTTGRAAAQPYFHADGRDIVADTTDARAAFRGVNLTGLEYGTIFHNPGASYVGTEGTDYFAPRAEDLDAVAGMGLNLVRVPFEWARLVTGWQGPALPTALNAGYLGLLDETVQMASDRGLYVVLDMHDYLKYWWGQSDYVLVNDSPPHQQMLARTWKLLAEHYADETTVLGYDIMNEPIREHAGPPNWHTIAQLVVNAIREVDTYHLIVVEGLNYSMASHWTLENGTTAFITDAVSPSRIVYSPHVYFDYDLDETRYDGPGEDVGPADGWLYYVRDRLLGVFDWSVSNNVPVFFGEVGVPSTPAWAGLLDHVFRYYFEPLHVSVAVWQYIDPARSSDPMNLAGDPERPVVDVLEWYPGGAYAAAGTPYAVPQDSLLYDDARMNPWQAAEGYWGNVEVDFAATAQVHQGTQALSVKYSDNCDGVKFVHHFGVDPQRYTHLQFWILATGTSKPDFRIFTTAPIQYWQPSPHPVFPEEFDDQPLLSEYADVPPGEWHQVRVPLVDIVDPGQPLINGVAFRNTGSAQDVLYLDEIRLVRLGVPVSLVGPSVPGEYEAGRTCGLLWRGGDSDTTLDIWRLGPAGWTVSATNVPALAGHCDWDTTAALPGWYIFAARVKIGDTWADDPAVGPDWLRVL